MNGKREKCSCTNVDVKSKTRERKDLEWLGSDDETTVELYSLMYRIEGRQIQHNKDEINTVGGSTVLIYLLFSSPGARVGNGK